MSRLPDPPRIGLPQAPRPQPQAQPGVRAAGPARPGFWDRLNAWGNQPVSAGKPGGIGEFLGTLGQGVDDLSEVTSQHPPAHPSAPSATSPFARPAAAPTPSLAPVAGVPSIAPPSPAPRSAQAAPAPGPAGTLEPWAQADVRRGGGNPADFAMLGNSLVSSRAPADIQADILAHPPVTTPAGRALTSHAPAGIGVPAAGAYAAQAAVGVGAAPATAAATPPRPSPAQAAGIPGSGAADSYYRGRFVPGPGGMPHWIKSQAELARSPGEWVKGPDWRDAEGLHEGASQFAANPHYGESPNAYVQGEHATYQQAHADDTNYRINGPEAAGAQLDEAGRTPRRLGVFALSRGQPPGVAQSVPGQPAPGQPHFNPANVEEAALDPEVRGLWGVLSNPELAFDQKLALAQSVPGVADPSSKHRQLVAAWLDHQAADREGWDRNLSEYSDTGAGVPNQLAGAGRVGRYLFGDHDARVRRNQQVQAHLQHYGYQFFPGQ